ncbi:MAG: hypothetical protein CMI15_11250 [Opitutaceae bacterium]|nr:hypothetical protein [Opitutaceae bacterium]
MIRFGPLASAISDRACNPGFEFENQPDKLLVPGRPAPPIMPRKLGGTRRSGAFNYSNATDDDTSDPPPEEDECSVSH